MTRPHAGWIFVDRITLTRISIAAIVLTITPALVYWLCSINSDVSYIGQPGIPTKNLWDAIYFSVITETTLGYGDIAPHGWLRLVAACQALGGVVLTGLGIAKLTAVQSRLFRATAYNAAGDWIEPIRMPDGKIIVSFSRIEERDGALCYHGENFDVDGLPLGVFGSQLLEAAGTTLIFRYSNRDSSVEYFGGGITTHRFMPDPLTGRWNRHHATCHDHDNKFTVQYEGFRATEEQTRIISGSDKKALVDLIKAYGEPLQPTALVPAK